MILYMSSASRCDGVKGDIDSSTRVKEDGKGKILFIGINGYTVNSVINGGIRGSSHRNQGGMSLGQEFDVGRGDHRTL